ncbi:hypothetical protein BJ741DRAFT_662064 [Chytriomyces cf. hyalinus JEL632]|nr:hypothetical protein BJ741DRAFT_662064 [Chytriomyces cf. hyalinus JEL632]
MTTIIPVEIQQLILIHLPVEKILANAPWTSEDMVFVLRHMQAAVDPPRELVESTIRFAVIHRSLTASVPQNSSPVNFTSDTQPKNALAWAAASGAADAVGLLLHCGLQTNEAYMDIALSILNANLAFDPSIDNSAPTVLACQCGRSKVAEVLLQDPHICLLLARNGHKDVVRLLLPEPRRYGEESAALVEASKRGHARIGELLVKDGRAKGSWENSSHNNFTSNNRLTNVLAWAAASGAVDTVGLLLRCGIQTCEPFMDITPAILNANPAFDPSIDNCAPLALACQYGHSIIAEAVLQDPRIDPNAAGMALITVGGWLDCVKSRNRHLLSAARNGHEDVVRLLLSEPRRDREESAALCRGGKRGTGTHN